MATKHLEQVPELMSYMINIPMGQSRIQELGVDSIRCSVLAASSLHRAYKLVKNQPFVVCSLLHRKSKTGGKMWPLSEFHSQDRNPDLGKRVKAVESAVIALATNPGTKPKQPSKPQEICQLYNVRRCRFCFCRYQHVCQLCEGNYSIGDCTGMKGTRVQASQGNHSLTPAKDHFISEPY